jgi:hypothetical protein
MYAKVPGPAPDFIAEGGSPLFSSSRAPPVPHRRHHQTLQFGQARAGPGGQGCREDQAGGRFRLGVGGHVTYAGTDQLRQEGHNHDVGTIEQNNHVQSLNHNGSEGGMHASAQTPHVRADGFLPRSRTVKPARG